MKDTDGIDVLTPECDESTLTYIIKHCYGVEQDIDPKHVIPLIEMAHLHEINLEISITFDNFFEIAQCLKHELNSELMSSVVSNYKQLFKYEDDFRKLPFELLVTILHKATHIYHQHEYKTHKQ